MKELFVDYNNVEEADDGNTTYYGGYITIWGDIPQEHNSHMAQWKLNSPNEKVVLCVRGNDRGDSTLDAIYSIVCDVFDIDPNDLDEDVYDSISSWGGIHRFYSNSQGIKCENINSDIIGFEYSDATYFRLVNKYQVDKLKSMTPDELHKEITDVLNHAMISSTLNCKAILNMREPDWEMIN